eukprot:364523-Chlamydomonas_euryale.AAC.7
MRCVLPKVSSLNSPPTLRESSASLAIANRGSNACIPPPLVQDPPPPGSEQVFALQRIECLHPSRSCPGSPPPKPLRAGICTTSARTYATFTCRTRPRKALARFRRGCSRRRRRWGCYCARCGRTGLACPHLHVHTCTLLYMVRACAIS